MAKVPQKGKEAVTQRQPHLHAVLDTQSQQRGEYSLCSNTGANQISIYFKVSNHCRSGSGSGRPNIVFFSSNDTIQ